MSEAVGTDKTNEVLYEVADHIATITLNAPERMNTISGPMLNDLARLLTEANEDRNVRVVILTGKGRAFCAGLPSVCPFAISSSNAFSDTAAISRSALRSAPEEAITHMPDVTAER